MGTEVTKGKLPRKACSHVHPSLCFLVLLPPPSKRASSVCFYLVVAAAEEFAAEPAAHVCAAPQASKISGRRSRPRPVPRKAAPQRGKRLNLLAHRRRRGGRRMLERKAGGGGGCTAVMACSWRIPPSRVLWWGRGCRVVWCGGLWWGPAERLVK